MGKSWLLAGPIAVAEFLVSDICITNIDPTKMGVSRFDQGAGHADFRLLVDSIPDYAIFMLDPDGCVQTWNAGARRILGYEPNEIIGSHFSKFYPESELSTNKPEVELRTARDNGRYEEEGWRVRKDGARFWANVIVTPLFDDEGTLKGYGKVTRDLTERRKYEERYRMIVEGVRDYGIFMLDPKGHIRSWNSGAALIIGYTAEEIIGRHFSTFYTQFDKDRDHPAEELAIAIERGRFEEEGWRVRKDGAQFWANVIITPLYDDNKDLVGFSKVTRDLTQRKRDEMALRESEERLRLMMANVKDYAIIMLDPKGNVVSWNAGAERIKGWAESEILGTSFERFYPPEDIAAGKTKMELEVAAREGRFEDYGWRVRKDGKRFWANVVITALYNENGELRGFSKVTRDITERKNAEEALRKAYEELESFSYSVSHDLRAPLRSMDGFSDILLRTIGDKLDERSKGYLNRIRESSTRMAKLIDDLLNLSRLSRTPLNKTSLDLSQMVQKVVDELRKTEPSREVEVKIQPELTVYADASLLHVAIENLVSNAWKYTSKASNPRIEFGCQMVNKHPQYYVRDNGAGFDMNYRAKLFGAFQRLHGADEFPGTGIGLATVKRIIHRHGGDVSAEGRPNEGATFYFTL